MCEWLAFGDWCDVRLLCGGRSFNVHRAVLASVSNFLRRALLSCPMDELPVSIILPEFDFDVISFILYYIYNGEVLIPNNKLKIFLDTANVMEIFIEQEYILQSTDYERRDSKTDYGDEILALSSSKNGCLIKVNKSKDSNTLVRLQQEPGSSLNERDKLVYIFKRCDDNILKYKENLSSISGYEEHKTFLRDTCINKHSGENRVNLRTQSVLSASNTSTSVLTSCANINLTRRCETLSNTRNRTLKVNNINSSFINYMKKLQDTDYKGNNKSNINMSCTIYNQLIDFNEKSIQENVSKKDYLVDLCQNYTPIQKYLPILTNDSFSKFKLQEQNSFLHLSNEKVTSNLNFRSKFPKVTIKNEVLRSPWHTRQPNSYKPCHKMAFMRTTHENKPSVSPLDENNNRDNKTNVTLYTKLISTEKQDLTCTVCQEVFTRRQDYTTHMRRHSSLTRYNCEECKKTFSQLRNYKYHMSVHRGTKEFAATCAVCGKHFNDKGYLSNHMKIHRNRKEYKCASCPKSFNQRVAFNIHVRIHTGVKPHVCETCGKAFSRKMLLKQHQRTHSGERPYACAQCDKRFADRSNMTLHLRLHTGVKPFSCTLCPKSFTKKHHLKSHLNFHTGAKPYSCPRCKLAFTQSSNMKTHFKKCNA